MKNSEKKYFDIHKRHDLIIRVSEKEYLGHNFFDIRQYYKNDEGEFKPTRKGVTFSHDLLEEVIDELKKLKRNA